MEITKPVKSSTLHRGKKTYFFDINQASNNKKYLKVTESRFMGEGQKNQRSSVVVFLEDVKDFQSQLAEIAGYLS